MLMGVCDYPIRGSNFPQVLSTSLCCHAILQQARLMKKKSRILAVDDEEAIAESIAYLLEAPHRTIAVAKDGKEALALAARQKFDIIITDHRMPRAGGLELVRQLRQRKYVGKIVLISAYLSADNIGAYEEMEVDQI